jgi:uncharacterized protein YkwD
MLLVGAVVTVGVPACGGGSIPSPQVVPVPAPAPVITAESSIRSAVLAEVNAVRGASNKPALRLDARLNSIAQAWAVNMNATGKLSHDGFATRLAAFPMAGECVAWGQSGPSQVVQDWKNSPGHLAVMVGDYTVAGVGRSGKFWCLNTAK